jgi:hypothetical protein
MSGLGQSYPPAGAARRLATLFEQNQGVPISRQQVRDVANQLDYMKRLRRNGGARDILDQKGIAILWGKGDSYVIGKLKLVLVAPDEFISYRSETPQELELLRSQGHSNLVSTSFS